MDNVTSTVPPATPTDLNQRIAERVRGLRLAQRLSLEALAERSGVSRSMLSLIERGEASATAVVLERVATGLGVMLASLFDPPGPAATPLARRADQPEWQDPGSGYVRRNVSPPGMASARIVAVEMPPNARVAYETTHHSGRVEHQVWVLDGTLTVDVGTDRTTLETGDCLAYVLDRPTAFHNPTASRTRYAVIISERP